MAKIVCLRSRRLRGHANIFAKTKEFVLMQIVMLQTEYSLTFTCSAIARSGQESNCNWIKV